VRARTPAITSHFFNCRTVRAAVIGPVMDFVLGQGTGPSQLLAGGQLNKSDKTFM
jgi:hypothetical protein